MDLYIAIGVFFVIAIFLAIVTTASQRVINVFKQYNTLQSFSGIKTEDFIATLKHHQKLTRLKIARISGSLTDCYVPSKRTIALSDSTIGNSSVAAIAVASHEYGHALQHEQKSFMYYLSRTVGWFCRLLGPLALPAIVVGLIFLIFASLAYIGQIILICAGSVIAAGLLFKILTISVELNASSRAVKVLREYNILNEQEIKCAKKIMNVAAFTYIADFLNTILGINFIKGKTRRK